MILILTIADDLHALAVQQRVRAAGGCDCFIVECDRAAQRNFLAFGIDHDVPARVMTSEQENVQISSCEVLWFRTTRSKQILRVPVDDEYARALIENDCTGALAGLLGTQFHGKWISTPAATYRASDKIYQLQAAFDQGLRVPKTLVTQSRRDVVDFFDACSGRIIAKSIVGAPGPLLETVRIDDARRLADESVEAAPTIYQEYIAGERHLRLNCFGDEVHAALIRTSDVDWRANLNVPIEEFRIDDDLRTAVLGVLEALGLEMGIVDMKLTDEDEAVWLEVNPQGQFLFLDALTTLRLADRFAEYLIRESRKPTVAEPAANRPQGSDTVVH